MRRRLKEVWRRELQAGLPGVDLVIRTKREAYKADLATLRGELLEWRKGL